MTTTDKRAAAIAELHYVHGYGFALGQRNLDLEGDGEINESKRLLLDTFNGMRARLAALEADDGRALRELQQWCDERQSDHRDHEVGSARDADEWSAANHAGQARAFRAVVNKIGDILAAPEQPAPEPATCDECGGTGRVGNGSSEEDCDCTLTEPAAPHADDEARIAEAEESMTLVVDTRPSVETLRTLVCSAVTMMRSLAAGKAKAEAEVERLTGVIDDTTNTEATNADTVADLREKLADAQADVERLRGRDAEPFDWDAAPSVQEWIDENLPEREPRAGSKMVELHPDEVIADRGESRRVAGWLKDLMAENARLRAERDAAQENLAWAMKQRDAALAAQNARAGLLGRAVEAISECLPDEDLNDLSTHFHMECKRHHFERLKDVRDEMECALRAAKPEPAAEPVPAAADAKPGDEVLRRWIRLDGKKSPTEWLAAMSVVVDELCRRALEVRP